MPNRSECSRSSVDRGEPMFATGSSVRGWLLVEVRGAWGEDAVHSSALGQFLPQGWNDDMRRRGMRVICVRSHLRSLGGGVRLFSCTPRRPGDQQARLWWRDVGSLADVADAAVDLAASREPGIGWQPTLQPAFFVCTNGRHDACCADYGRPLVRALRTSRWAPDLWECSHIGGDRFAANLVVLPHSLYFGRVTPESALAVIEAIEAGELDLAHFRGRTSYSPAEQAVEHFVRQEFGVVTIDGVVVGDRSSDGSYAVQLGEREVFVRVRRHMTSVAESLTCKGRTGQLVPAYALESIG